MKTRITTEGEVTVVELSGYLDFESARPIKDSIDVVYKANQNAQVVIDLRALEFVGSSGVSTFVKSMRVFNTLRMKPCYFGVKNEFVRLFRAFAEEEPFEVMDNKDAAKTASLARWNRWQMTTERSKATH